MILDTSAAFAIVKREPEAEDFLHRIYEAGMVRMSVASPLELTTVIARQFEALAARQAEAFVLEIGVVIEPVSLEQSRLARQAFLDFGKGRHPARLNFGDCFAYALAKATGEPLLFKGDDFARTDVAAA